MSRGYEQCDVVTDQFFVGSLKKGTRKAYGYDGSTMQFTGDNQFSFSFDDFLDNSVRKITWVSFSLISCFYFIVATLP